MRFYSLYINENDRKMSDDYLKAISESKTIGQKLLGPIYFISKNMWKYAFLYIFIEIILLIIGIKIMKICGLDLAIWIFSIHIYFSWLYFYLETYYLESNGYIFKQVIVAKNEEDAVLKYLTRFANKT